MKILITGAAGFAGSHLIDHLSEKKNVKVVALVRDGKHPNIPHIRGKASVEICDILKPQAFKNVISRVKPDGIFHLAAQSHVPRSWSHPDEVIHSNVLGQVNLFEAVLSSKIKCKIHIASSSEEYGVVSKKYLPVTEQSPVAPVTPYGISKAAQTQLAVAYFRRYGLDVVVTRAFSHTGPGQDAMYVASDFAKQVALVEAGRQKAEIHVGNVNAERDFSDVRDVVRAYWLALQKGSSGEVYNVCSAKGIKIEDILQFYLKRSPVKIKVLKDASRFRPGEVPSIVGSHQKLTACSGWKPVLTMERTLTDLLGQWRQKTSALSKLKK